MRLIIFLALYAFCNTFGVNGEKSFDYHVERIDKMNETDDLIKYTLNVEKVNETTVKINSDSDLFVELNDEWHMWIQVFHNKDGKEEFGDPFMSFKKKAICEFMQSTYKDKLWPYLENCSNFPRPDECPVKPGNYKMTNCVVNMEKYSALAKPGMWKVAMFLSQDHEESHVTKFGIDILTLVTPKDE